MPSRQPDVSAFLDDGNVFAVVGVSDDPAKYGHKVFLDLMEAGYTVYAVHPSGGEVAGRPRYPDLAGLPETPDVVSLVVPPAVAERVVRECDALGIKRVWMQPGAESDAALAYCAERGIEVLHGVCVMVERKRV